MSHEYSVSEIRPYKILSGVITTDHDAPPDRFVVKRTFTNELGRRVTKFVGEGYSREDADQIVAALSANSPA